MREKATIARSVLETVLMDHYIRAPKQPIGYTAIAREVAEKGVSITRQGVWWLYPIIATKMPVPPVIHRKPSIDEELLLQQLGEGQSDQQISDELLLSKALVHRVRVEHEKLLRQSARDKEVSQVGELLVLRFTPKQIIEITGMSQPKVLHLTSKLYRQYPELRFNQRK